jgi:hypothetical protein
MRQLRQSEVPRFSGVFEDWFDLADQTPTTATPHPRALAARGPRACTPGGCSAPRCANPGIW